ncbi:MAG: hypothetical protein KDJ88_19620, partial [Bauldia sp.]|nr:hypothetical protein [Bauldia sp.]
ADVAVADQPRRQLRADHSRGPENHYFHFFPPIAESPDSPACFPARNGYAATLPRNGKAATTDR